MRAHTYKLEALSQGLVVTHIFGRTPGVELNQQPSPLGRGCPAPALSPAGAGRARGHLLSFANQPLPRGAGEGLDARIGRIILLHVFGD